MIKMFMKSLEQKELMLYLYKTVIEIDPVNNASERILLKLGFKEVFKRQDEFGLETVYFAIKP